jgi:Peptidase family M28
MVLAMMNGRLYRAAFVPFVFALALAAFSLTPRPRPLSSTLAPDAFEGAHAFAELRRLAGEFPDRRPGSPGDQALAAHVERTLEGLGGTAGGGFSVRRSSFQAQTIDGERSLSTVIAQRPGSTDATPIVILAHRDAAARGSLAELSATAALLELARVFAARETQRTIVLASVSGGSGGDGGATDFAANVHGPFDAAIVLGDLAGVHESKPFVVPYSDGFGSAPGRLARTAAGAITREVGVDPGSPSALGQLAHLAFPLTVGEQGSLNARGIGAVLVQVGGERGPAAGEAVSQERLEGFGRAVLSTVDALDAAPDIDSSAQTGVVIQRKLIPGWALRLLVATLLLPPLLLAVDGLARMRRRREPVARRLLWTLSCALPFFAAALFARLLGWSGMIGAAPAAPVLPSALPFDGLAAEAVTAVGLVLALAWLLWPRLLRRLGLELRPDSDTAAVAMLAVLVVLGFVVWAINPYAALLLLAATHLWLPLGFSAGQIEIGRRLSRLGALALVALALLPLVLLISFYVDQLGLSPGGLAWGAVLLLAGGHVGVFAAMLWSLGLGCAVASAMLALRPPPLSGAVVEGHAEVTIRGPLSYAGPGSLGGTESAVRR